MSESIAIFGSAFNPPSLGHLSVLQQLTHFDRVFLVPSFSHAWGKPMMDFDYRCQLIEAFISDAQQPNLTLSRIESTLDESPITTFLLLSKLQDHYPEANFTFVMGPDNLLNFSQFDRSNDILSQWKVLTCPQTVDIRSTDIRNALAEHQDIQHLTTPSVAKKLMNQAQ